MPIEQSRRLFLKTSAGLGLLAGIPRVWGAAAVLPPATEHPGLLFGPADLPRIRATLARPEFAAYLKASLGDPGADEHFLRDEIQMTNASADLARAGGILLRCAFVHAVAPEARHVSVARLALSRIMAFRRWDWII